MFNKFSFSAPSNVSFGVGTMAQIGSRLKKSKVDKVLLLSDRGLEKVGMVAKLEEALNAEGISYVSFLDVEPNSSVETVEAATEVYKSNNLTAILCLGGGSAIDTGKAVAVMASHEGALVDYEGFNKVTNKLPLLIAIPTTAGTGSETTNTAVIHDKKRHYKFSIISNKIVPSIIILDPKLISSLPPVIAASTGIDALTHAMEAYISTMASPFSDALALKAVELIGRSIRRFSANRADIDAASDMIIGSTFAGMAFSISNLGISHAMAHPLGAYAGVPHGIANSIFLPVALEYNKIADKENRYLQMYNLVKTQTAVTTDFEPEMLVDEVQKLIADLGLPTTLTELNVDKNLVETMAIDAMKSECNLTNPRTASVEIYKNLYLSCF